MDSEDVLDLNEGDIVEEFSKVLDELTFNSRPIITSLTKLAEEHIKFAQNFVDLIESKIEKCIPKQKLFIFYALDSICKNAGSPYTIFFSRNLFNLYKKTYLLVDNVTRTKLINMFKTWINQNQNSISDPLFETEVLEKIEKFLIKASTFHQKNLQDMLPVPTVPLLLKEIDKLTLLTNERLKDQNLNSQEIDKLKMKLLVLAKLKEELQKEKLTLAALKQVQVQLRQVFSQDQQVLYYQQQEKQFQQQQERERQLKLEEKMQQQQQSASSSSNSPSVPSLFNSDNSTPGIFQSSLFGEVQGIFTPPNFSVIEKNAKVDKLEKFYKALKDAKLIYEPKSESIVKLFKNLQDNNMDNNGMTEEERNKRLLLAKIPSVNVLNSIINDYKAYHDTRNIDVINNQFIGMNQVFLLNNEDNDDRKKFVNLLYRNKPTKCTQCGKRFGISNEEKKNLNSHLDWHFRINKRIKGSNTISNTSVGINKSITQKNIQSRNWYLDSEDWCKFKDDEIVSTQMMNNNYNKFNKDKDNSKNNTNMQGNNNNNIPLGIPTDHEKVVHVQKTYIIVPESTEDLSYRCNICKENVNAVYDEELGEWIWKNTIRDNSGKLYHRTCFLEASKENVDGPEPKRQHI